MSCAPPWVYKPGVDVDAQVHAHWHGAEDRGSKQTANDVEVEMGKALPIAADKCSAKEQEATGEDDAPARSDPAPDEDVDVDLFLQCPSDIPHPRKIWQELRPAHTHVLDTFGYGRCLLYTSPSPRDKRQSRMPSSA